MNTEIFSVGVAEASDVILLCLPDSPDVEQVLIGRESENYPLVEELSERVTLIDYRLITSTVLESLASDLAAVGMILSDAPVADGESVAVAGTLSIMVGDDEEALAEHRDILEAIAESSSH